MPLAPQKTSLSLFADLELAVYTHEGRERTAAEYRALLETAQFSLTQQKTYLLNEFVSLTGYARTYAIRLLNYPGQAGSPSKRSSLLQKR